MLLSFFCRLAGSPVKRSFRLTSLLRLIFLARDGPITVSRGGDLRPSVIWPRSPLGLVHRMRCARSFTRSLDVMLPGFAPDFLFFFCNFLAELGGPDSSGNKHFSSGDFALSFLFSPFRLRIGLTESRSVSSFSLSPETHLGFPRLRRVVIAPPFVRHTLF